MAVMDSQHRIIQTMQEDAAKQPIGLEQEALGMIPGTGHIMVIIGLVLLPAKNTTS